MKIPYLDLSVGDKSLKDDLLTAVDRVLSHGRVVLGPEIAEFEKIPNPEFMWWNIFMGFRYQPYKCDDN
mgnify:CR=1 FL=1